jgi:hypothetical protein
MAFLICTPPSLPLFIYLFFDSASAYCLPAELLPFGKSLLLSSFFFLLSSFFFLLPPPPPLFLWLNFMKFENLSNSQIEKNKFREFKNFCKFQRNSHFRNNAQIIIN